ncbi:LLM class flavin-dependent oxidoreductase [Micromonospora pattaloongensis]|uniref:LLM class flavin-dependent oxidoreductase n=1 Tax=Micromonospora pattaloongensis TaxID=405436 RepID=UPI000ACCB54C|nr:LLM class flavin-dependent oxidoreductase [Micromonospora pattaloongensis]
MPSITISVQAEPRDAASWLALASRLDAGGFEALLVGDHPGSGPAPWPALGAAAAVTTRLRLGTYVLQAGVRDPVQAAADAATLDLLAPGRVLFGLGAGHTFAEWEATGRPRPGAGDRAGRLVEFVDAVSRLLNGETVTIAGHHLSLLRARLDDLPTSGRVRLVIGGGHRRILQAAAARADVVALSGLGRTLADGHRHHVRWSRAHLDAMLDVVRAESRRLGTTPEIEALVQVVTVTNKRAEVLAELAQRLPGATPDDLAQTPFLLVGSIEQMAHQLARQAQQFGISRYVVREPAVDTAEQLLPFLAER